MEDGPTYFSRYGARLRAPHVGDEVEVRWVGRFSLVENGKKASYEGKSW